MKQALLNAIAIYVDPELHWVEGKILFFSMKFWISVYEI
jgi:hypothetical protein